MNELETDDRAFPDRIRQILEDEPSREYAKESLGQLRDNIKDAQAEVRRLLLTMLLLSFIFVLLDRDAISEFSLGLVKVSDLTFAVKLLPLVTAFIYFSIVSRVVLIWLLRRVHDDIVRDIYRKWNDSRIDMFLYPPSTFYMLNIISSFGPPRERMSNFTYWAFALFSLFVYVAVLLSPCALEAYMFWVSFSQFGFGDILVWISLALSIVLFVQSVLYVLLAVDLEVGEFTL